MDRLDRENKIKHLDMEIHAEIMKGIIKTKHLITKLYNEKLDIFKRYYDSLNIEDEEFLTIGDIDFKNISFERVDYKKLVEKNNLLETEEAKNCKKIVCRPYIKINKGEGEDENV